MTWRPRSVTTVDIALGNDRLFASWVTRGVSLRAPCNDPQQRACSVRFDRRLDEADPAETLDAALEEVALALPDGDRTRLRIAILPPLALLRRLELPRMRDSELRQVIARNAGRYFLGAREPVVAGAEWLGSAGRSPCPLMTSAVRSSVIEALGGAANSRGWSIEAILPAHVAWRDLACAVDPSLVRGRTCLFVYAGDEILALELGDGVITALRRMRGGDAGDLSVHFGDDTNTGKSQTRVAVIGTAAQCDALERVGANRFATVVARQQAAHGEVADRLDAATDAALSGLSARSSIAQRLELVPAGVRRLRAKRSQRVAYGLFAASVALLMASAGLRLWSIRRQLDAVRVRRQTLHTRVETALALRDTVEALGSRLTDIGALEKSAPRWSAVISHIAEGLPITAYLSALRAQGDSLLLEGQGTSAAEVFADMRDTPGISAVRARTPIRQEIVPGQAPVERWTLAAHAVAALDTTAVERVARAKDNRTAEDK